MPREALEMARSALATICCLASIFAMTSTARAGLPCSGVVVTDESAPGELTPVGEPCYEPGPFFYDAPGRRPGVQVPERPLQPSVSIFEVSTIRALGVVNLGDLTNPFPPGQGRADFRPE